MARKFSPDDFDRFDKIFVMIRSNLCNVKKLGLTPVDQNKETLLLENDQVPDRYNGNEGSFKRFLISLTKAVYNGVIHHKKTRS